MKCMIDIFYIKTTLTITFNDIKLTEKMKKTLYIVGGVIALFLMIRLCNSSDSSTNEGPSKEELSNFKPELSTKNLAFKTKDKFSSTVRSVNN